MAALLAGSALFAGIGVAQGATYPQDGGSAFDAGPEGWSGSGAQCSTGSGTPLCTQENVYEGDSGNPGGNLVARTSVAASGAEQFRGDSTWRSPSFVAQATEGTATLRYDRRFEAGGLVSLAPHAAIEAVLVDESNGASLSLGTEELTTTDSTFATRQLAVARGSLVAGRSYHLELRSETTATASVGGLGSAEVHYDNVSLVTADPSGAAGSPGVTFPKAPLSEGSIDALIASIPLGAEVGRNAGGTLIGVDKCTILGTAGNDRIRGSNGNDVICGLGGNDTIDSGRGKDLVDGGSGKDRLAGSPGNDLLLGLGGSDRLVGGSGKDRVGAGAGADRARGFTGNDRLVGASGADRLAGDAGADVLAGGRGNDRLRGGRGSDRLAGGGGRDRIGARDRRRDRVDGGSGRDRAKVDARRLGLARRDVVRRVESR